MNLRPIPATLAALLWASAVGASAAHAQAYMKIDTILGESADAAHKDEIAVESYSFGAQTAVSLAAGAGAAVGKPTFDTLQFTHQTDRATPALMLALARGQHLKTAVLSVRKRGANADYLKITLSDVLVSSVKVSGNADAPAKDEVRLTYARIQIEYFTVQRDGKLVPAGKMTWDIARNSPG